LILILILLLGVSCIKNADDPVLRPSSDQYINYTIGGNTINFNLADDSIYCRRIGTDANFAGFKRVFDSASYRYTSFNIAGFAAPGTYNINKGTFIVTRSFNLDYNMEGTLSVMISEYGNPGEYVAGTFSGNFREFYTNAVTTGTCSFRIRRYQ
jgi:hypothetical protein